MHHEVLSYLLGIAVLLGVAHGLGQLCRRIGIPAVAGEIVGGIVVGKSVLGRLSPAAFTWLFPEGAAKTMLSGYTTIAVMLLLVVAGLEIDLSVVKRSGKVVVLTAAAGVVLPFALGYGLGFLLPDGDLVGPGRRQLHAAFLGIALSISALPVIAKTLLELGLMKTDLGLIILSAAVLNDLAGWIGFSVLSRQFEKGAPGPGALALSVGLTAAFVVAALLVVRPFADRVFARIQGPKDASSGKVLAFIMVMALIGASATQAAGMHPVFGGFVMGIALGDSSRLREQTRQQLHDFVTYVFTPVFFATMALRFDFLASFDLRLTLVVMAIACMAKIAGSSVGARVGGVAWRESLAIGFGLNSRGAMEILLAVLALEAGIIREPMFVALVIMALATSMMSGPALVKLLKPKSSPLVALLRAGKIVLDPVMTSRTELIWAMSDAAAEAMGRPEAANQIGGLVLEREEMASTGAGDGVAFPHAEVPGLAGPSLTLARLGRGVDFDAPDGQPVRLVFLLLMPPREYDRHLQLLSALARLLSRAEVRRDLLAARDPADVFETLDDAGRTPLPGAKASNEPASASG